MQIIVIFIGVCTALFWVIRILHGANEGARAVDNLRNMPSRLRFRSKASQRSLALIDSPLEAATILMVSVAKLSDYTAAHDGLISGASTGRIIDVLKFYMKISAVEADEVLTQMRWLVKDFAQPDTALAPMTNVLRASTSRAEADELSDMLRKISHADGVPNPEQRAFIARVRERMGLGV